MMKRLWVLLALAALLATALIILSTLEGKSPGAPGGQPTQNLQFRALPAGFGIADSGSAKLAYARLNITSPSDANVTILLIPHGTKQDVYLLDYPRIDAEQYSQFSSELRTELGSYGIGPKEARAASLDSVSRSVVIVPTGAFPLPLSYSLDGLLQRGNAIIYVGRDTDFLLDEDSSLVPSNFSPEYTRTGESSSVLESGEGSLLHIRRTLNSYPSPKEAASEISSIILRSGWEEPLSSATYSLPAGFSGARFFTAQPSQARGGTVLAIVSSNSGNALFSGAVRPAPGTLSLPQSSFPGDEMGVQLVLNESYAQPVFLVLTFVIWDADGNILTKPAGEASVRSAWFSDFAMRNPLQPGDYVISCADQFGREHAAAFLHVKNLSATVRSADSRTFEFAIMLDGKPLDSETATVSAGNSEAGGAYPVSGGRMLVFASLPAGEQFFRVRALGKELVVPYAGNSGGALEVYIKYGVPGILLALAVILVFTRKPARKYSVIVPDLAGENARTEELSLQEILSVFGKANSDFGWSGVPLSAKEFRKALQRHVLRNGKGIVASDANAEDVLDSLAAKGTLSSWRGFYCPAGWAKGKGAAGLALRRIIRDAAIASGAEFDEKNLAVKIGKTAVHFLLVNEGEPDSGLGERITKELRRTKAKTCVVFPDGKGIGGFRQGIPSSQENAAISIALRSGRLVLASPETIGETL